MQRELPNVRKPRLTSPEAIAEVFEEHPDGSRSLRKPPAKEARRKQKPQPKRNEVT
jgi:hypothetical protein